MQPTKLFRSLVLLLPLAGLTGCVPHTTAATEVGMRFNKLTGSYEVMQPARPTSSFRSSTIGRPTTSHCANLVMTAESSGRDRAEKDDLRFKTRDGNDIETDVTVRWHVDTTQVETLWKTVAPDTDAVEERLVRPLARSYIRDVLSRLSSEDYYNPQLRFAAANDATRLLSAHLKSYGVVVEQVLLGNFSFKPSTRT